MEIEILIISSNKKTGRIFARRTVNLDGRIKKLDAIYLQTAEFIVEYQQLTQRNRAKGYNGLRSFPKTNTFGLIIKGRSETRTVEAELNLHNFGKLLDLIDLKTLVELIEDNMMFVEKWADWK